MRRAPVSELGALGQGTPDQALDRLVEQCKPYRAHGLRIVPAFDLIATMALEKPGPDGRHRRRLPGEAIREYLHQVRSVGGLLILEIQPGGAEVLEEVRAYERFLRAPDVGVALDPEWAAPDEGVPGRPTGSIEPETVNGVAKYLRGLVERYGLRKKLLLVHHFADFMITGKQRLEPQRGVAMILNFDGVGARKGTKYQRLAKARPDLAHGIKLFYEADDTLLQPAEVLKLRPRPVIVSYA
jgi:hypothetical protein